MICLECSKVINHERSIFKHFRTEHPSLRFMKYERDGQIFVYFFDKKLKRLTRHSAEAWSEITEYLTKQSTQIKDHSTTKKSTQTKDHFTIPLSVHTAALQQMTVEN